MLCSLAYSFQFMWSNLRAFYTVCPVISLGKCKKDLLLTHWSYAFLHWPIDIWIWFFCALPWSFDHLSTVWYDTICRHNSSGLHHEKSLNSRCPPLNVSCHSHAPISENIKQFSFSSCLSHNLSLKILLSEAVEPMELLSWRIWVNGQMLNNNKAQHSVNRACKNVTRDTHAP